MKRLLPIIILASSALAGDYYVVPVGTAGNTPTSPYDSWATAANTIADAVGAIPDNNGAVVHVAPGTYAVAAQISVSRSNVEIRSDDGSGRLARETTILDGGGRAVDDYDSLHRLFNVSGNNVTVRGLTLQNNISNGSGAGAYVTGSAFTLADCTLTNLQGRVSTADGGALYYSATSGKGHVIDNCLVIQCGGNAYGGAIYAGPKLSSYSAPVNYLYLVDSEFVGNFCSRLSIDSPGHSTRGRLSAGPIYAVRCRFDDAGGSGSNFFGDNTNYSIFTNCTFKNIASSLFYSAGETTRAYDCTFNKNNCSYNFNLMERCVFSNEVDRNGSSCNFSGATVRNCLYAFNDFPVSGGGNALFENCTIVSNRTGGVLMGPSGGTARFVNCVVFGNKFKNYGPPGDNRNFNYRSQWAGGASSSLILSNCYFEGCANVSVSSYKGKYIDPETGTLVNANGAKTLFSFDPSGMSATVSAAADADKAMLFADWQNGDWHLGGVSALRDAGLKLGWMTSGATDLDGRPRVVDADGVAFSETALPDLGCYETTLISGSITTTARPFEYASNGLPKYGYVNGIDAGSYLRTAPETVSVSDSEQALCAGWRLYRFADDIETLVGASTNAGETATSCTIAYDGGDWRLIWLWDTQYIVADADGEPVWRTYETTPHESAPTISDLVCDTSLGNPVVVTGSVSGFADGCAVTVVTSASPDFSNALSWTNAFAVLDEAGAFSITLQCDDPESLYYLVPGTTYYIAVCAESEEGTTWTAPATVARAATAYVVPAGTAGNTPLPPYASWATAANTVADAVAALAGVVDASVRIAPGTYAVGGQITIATAGLEVRSDDKSGHLARATTVLDGGFRALGDSERTNRLFNVSANRVTIRGLTLQNACAKGSGAGVYTTGSALTLADCTLTNLQGRVSTADGGALYYSATSGKGHVITNCLVIQCAGNAYGGAIFAGPAISSYSAPVNYLYLVDSAFVGNTCSRLSIDSPGHSTRGRLSAGPIYAVRCRFDDTGGSGNNFFGDNTNYSIFTNCTFKNIASSLFYSAGETTRAYDCAFDKCSVSYNFALAERCVFSNEVDRVGGSRNFSGGTFRSCLYAGNDFPVSPGGNALFENCTIVSNRTGGILMGPDGGSGKFVNCVVFGNKFKNYGAPGNNRNFNYRSQWAGGSTSSLVISNCYIEGTASCSVNSYKGKYVDSATGAFVNGDGTVRTLFSFDPSGTSSNITAAADAAKTRVFVDWTNGDWRLQRKSPLRDAGLLRSWMGEDATDLDGNPRVTDRFGKAFGSDARPDLGCYECQIFTTHATTIMLR